MSVGVKWIKQFLQTTETKSLLYAAAGLSIFAALVHGIVTPEHFEEWWGYGTFFMTAALVQLFYGLLLIFQPWQPDPIRDTKGFSAAYLYWAGIVGNGLLIVLYIITRTVGIPFFGPEAGEIEEVTILSLVSKILEASLIVMLFVLLRRSKVEPR
jgi:hypothetical protein